MNVLTAVSLWTLVTIIPSVMSQLRCQASDISFQLLSGYVYTNTDDIIKTVTGVFDLVSCLSQCRGDPLCQSVNYETGLCVTFSSSAPEYVSESQLPVWTVSAEKICLPTISEKRCDTAFAFEKVPDSFLEAKEELSLPVGDVSECRTKCRDETRFVCRSVNYNRVQRRCLLLTHDRLPGSQSGGKLLGSGDMDYLENTCLARYTGVCDFKPRMGLLLKTVDSVKSGVGSIEECQRLCRGLTTFHCLSYDWAHTGPGVCRLSHHRPETLGHVREPYLRVNTSATYIISNCYNLSVTCHHQSMLATVTSNKEFSGKLYTKSRPHSCVADIEQQTEFSLSIGYNDINCDVEMDTESGRVETEVILQHHDKIVTSGDIGLHVSCVYNINSSIVYQAMDLGEELPNRGYAEQMMLRSPEIRMRITDQGGDDIRTAMVGDPLAIRFEILDTDTAYDMFVRDLVAMDGQASSNILLVDSMGCPTDASIIKTLSTVRESPKIVQANFDAFKFAGSSVVQFRAMVTPCIPRCDPVTCDNGHHSRVRRSTFMRNLTEFTHPEDESTVLVANRLRIVDRPGDIGDDVITTGEIEARGCGYRAEHLATVYTVMLVLGLVLLCQCLVILLCVKLRKHHRDNNDF